MDAYREFYDEKAAGYGDVDVTGLLRYRAALSIAQLQPGQKVLDVACKRGSLVHILDVDKVDIVYTGLDIARQNVEENRSRWPDRAFVEGDVMDEVPLPDGVFDRVFALEIMEHVPHPLRLLEQARRLLAPDGRLVISVPNPYYWVEWIREAKGQPDPEGHVYAWSDANLRGLLAMAGFAVEERTGTYLEVPLALRRPFRRGKVAHLTRIPALLARSRVYRCRKA